MRGSRLSTKSLDAGKKPMTKFLVEQFLDAFVEEWETVRAETSSSDLCPYTDLPRWTEFMMGITGVLSRVAKRLRTIDSGMQYRREVYTIDGLFVGGRDLFRSDLDYPSAIHVLIEHEMGENVEEEMWKLIFWRAPLKVLIIYDWAEDEKVNISRQSWLPNKLRALSDMLEAVNEFHGEGLGTSYLFVIGIRREGLGSVTWTWASNLALQPTPLKRRG